MPRLGSVIVVVLLAGAAAPPLQASPPQAPPPQAPRDSRDTEAMALVRRVIEAKGGLAAVKAVRTLVADATTVIQTRPTALTSTTRTYVSYPDRFRIDATLPGNVVVTQVYNRGQAWVRDPNGVSEAPAAMRDEFAGGVRRDVITLLVGASDGSLRVRPLPGEGNLQVLEFSGPQLSAARLYIDRDNVVARAAHATMDAEGRPVTVEELFSDYRRVSGVSVAYHAEVRQAGSPVVTRTLTTVAINVPVDPLLFEKPR